MSKHETTKVNSSHPNIESQRYHERISPLKALNSFPYATRTKTTMAHHGSDKCDIESTNHSQQQQPEQTPPLPPLRRKRSSLRNPFRSRKSSEQLRQRAATPTPSILATVREVREGPILKSSSSAMFIAKMKSELFLSQFKRVRNSPTLSLLHPIHSISHEPYSHTIHYRPKKPTSSTTSLSADTAAPSSSKHPLCTSTPVSKPFNS